MVLWNPREAQAAVLLEDRQHKLAVIAGRALYVQCTFRVHLYAYSCVPCPLRDELALIDVLT